MKWFVDGSSYFDDLYQKILEAKETIFLAGWWISPELFLQRPVCTENPGPLNKLQDVLKYKADRGVLIYILIFKEVSLALNLSSGHSKKMFYNIHPNIKITRHPKSNFELMWSHHEKMVVIDQKYAYLGGIDLCWGRYDTSEHLITEPYNDNNTYIFPGIDYSNLRIRDFENVQEYTTEAVDRMNEYRMPWHDVMVLFEGPVVTDISRHFVERWNFARNKTNSITNGIIFVL